MSPPAWVTQSSSFIGKAKGPGHICALTSREYMAPKVAH